uniref:Neur_chan_LBD domain-containing protein n=1 Tax=Rhabditophanes sp. KR3021 TaxID=114890 RepID=A0AC35TNJ8_9BILA
MQTCLNNGDWVDRKEFRMDKIRIYATEPLQIKPAVPSKKVAKHLEFILIERFKHQITDYNYRECSVPDVYLLNSVNGCAVADTSTQTMFEFKMTSDN